MIRYIKNHMPFIWSMIDTMNNMMCLTLFSSKIQSITHSVLNGFDLELRVEVVDNQLLSDACSYLKSITEEDKCYFRPFAFTDRDILLFLSKKSNPFFLVYDNRNIVGAFFLRFFINRQAYLGFIVSSNYRGKGLGTAIIRNLSKACKENSFPLYSTVSSENVPSWKTHIKNGFVIRREMPGHYFLMRS